MSFIKKEGYVIINGMEAVKETLTEEFYNYLYKTQNKISIEERDELIKEIEEKFNKPCLEGMKGSYPSITFAFNTYEPNQTLYLIKSMAEEILRYQAHLKNEEVIIFRNKLSISIQNNTLYAVCRIAFIPKEELVPVLERLNNNV